MIPTLKSSRRNDHDDDDDDYSFSSDSEYIKSSFLFNVTVDILLASLSLCQHSSLLQREKMSFFFFQKNIQVCVYSTTCLRLAYIRNILRESSFNRHYTQGARSHSQNIFTSTFPCSTLSTCLLNVIARNR